MKKQAFYYIFLLIGAALLIGCSDEFGEFGEFDEEDGIGYSNGDTGRALFVFGDSWTDAMDDGIIQQELADRSFEHVIVNEHAVGGTTMASWANNDDNLLEELIESIQEEPSPNPIVFFTLSGNDLLGGDSVSNIESNLHELLTILEESRSDLQIVYAPYDILNPDIAPEVCNDLWLSIFDTTEATEVNPQWIGMYDRAAGIVDEFDRATTMNTFGTLQGNPGNPDISRWSPVEYSADCIHLNEEGYGVWLDTVFDEALTPIICEDEAVVAPACGTG